MMNSNPLQAANGFNSNVDALRLVITNNFPKEIQDELWGLTSKILPLGNYDAGVADYIEVQMNKLELAELENIPDDELEDYDETKWPQVRAIMKVILSLGTGGALLDRTTGSILSMGQNPEQVNAAGKKDWKEIFFGSEGNDSITPASIGNRW